MGRRLHMFLSCKLVGIENYDYNPEERDVGTSKFLTHTFEGKISRNRAKFPISKLKNALKIVFVQSNQRNFVRICASKLQAY